MRFQLEQQPIHDTDTPALLEMEFKDTVHACWQQTLFTTRGPAFYYGTWFPQTKNTFPVRKLQIGSTTSPTTAVWDSLFLHVPLPHSVITHKAMGIYVSVLPFFFFK